MHTFTLLLEAYGSKKVSFETARRLKKKFKTDTEYVQGTGKSDQLVSVTCKENVSNKGENEGYSRYTIHDIPKAEGTSL